MKAVECIRREWPGLCSVPSADDKTITNLPMDLNSKSETRALHSELAPTAPSTTSHFLKLAVNRGREGPGACQAKQKLVSNLERQNKCSAVPGQHHARRQSHGGGCGRAGGSGRAGGCGRVRCLSRARCPGRARCLSRARGSGTRVKVRSGARRAGADPG